VVAITDIVKPREEAAFVTDALPKNYTSFKLKEVRALE
jgi:hypothetical protein